MKQVKALILTSGVTAFGFALAMDGLRFSSSGEAVDNPRTLVLGGFTESDLDHPMAALHRLVIFEGQTSYAGSHGRTFKRLTGFISHSNLKRRPPEVQCPFPEEGHILMEGVRYDDGSYLFKSDQFVHSHAAMASKPAISSVFLGKGNFHKVDAMTMKAGRTECESLNNPSCKTIPFPDMEFKNLEAAQASLTEKNIKAAGMQLELWEGLTFKWDCKSRNSCTLGRLSFARPEYSAEAIQRHPMLQEDKPLGGMLDLIEVKSESGRMVMTPKASLPLMGQVSQADYVFHSNFARSDTPFLPPTPGMEPVHIKLRRVGDAWKGYAQVQRIGEEGIAALEYSILEFMTPDELHKTWSKLP